MNRVKRALLAGPVVLAAAGLASLTACHDTLEPVDTRPGTLPLAATSSSPALTSSLGGGAVFTFAIIPGLARAYSINNAGMVVGDHGGNNIAAVWTPSGGLTTVGRLDGSTACCSSFTEVNASGEASGWSHTNVGVSAVLWTPALGSTDLQIPAGRATALGINDAGDVVGAFLGPNPFRAFFRPAAGSHVQLQSFPGTASELAYDINNSGMIVGESDIAGNGGGHALVWPQWNVAPIDLGTLGGPISRARAVNDAGDVVGSALRAGGEQHAFVWTSSSGMIDLDTWPNGCNGTSEATGISNSGIIVGRCNGAPVFWTAVEGMRVLPLPAGVSHGDPQSINSANQIVGMYNSNSFGAAMWTLANQPPLAVAGGPYEGTIGTPIAFSSAGSLDPDNDPLAYSWDFGDGGTSDAADPSHTYAEAGTYTATLTVSDPVGASSVATATVTIAKAVPAIDWQAAASLVLGSPYGSSLNATATGVDGAALDGVFTYRNAEGTVITAASVPGVGADQALFVDFVPTDEAHYTSASASAHISVLYDFAGFFAPVNNKPTVNAANAGQAIPVKFSLSGDRGLDIFQPSSPSSTAYSCGGGTLDAIEETMTASASGLTYDEASGQYVYVWKTEKAWAKSCRKLVLRFQDGTVREALFNFTK